MQRASQAAIPHLEPQTRNLKPEILNTKPQTRKSPQRSWEDSGILAERALLAAELTPAGLLAPGYDRFQGAHFRVELQRLGLSDSFFALLGLTEA